MKISYGRFQHLANFLGIITGLAYAWTRYFTGNSDPFSNVGNPWEPFFHNSHIWVVPLLVFACGLIWQSHILPMWKNLNPKNRGLKKVISGVCLLFIFCPMVATGYLIQTTVEENWRKIWVAVHLITSAVWAISYIVHFLGETLDKRPNA